MVITKLRSTTIKRVKHRKRVTRLKPKEFIVAERQIKKTRIIPIPIIVGKKEKIKPAKPIKIPKIDARLKIKGVAVPKKLTAQIQQGQRQGKVLGGPVQSSVASAVWYWPDTLLMVINYHGGSEYEYYTVQYDLFNYIYNGLGTATSDGQNQYGRWWKGKSNPSVGASIYWRLRGSGTPYRRVR